jgi:hypothetical protein
MKRIPMIAAIAATLAFGAQVDAQETRADTEAELREMVVAPTSADEDRALIRSFLDSEGVAAVAEDRGIDIESVKERVRTLGADDAADLAERVRQDTQQDPDLVGGDTLVISSTVIIIALLVIIVIAVA